MTTRSARLGWTSSTGRSTDVPFLVPANEVWIVKSFIIVNTSGSPVEVNCYVTSPEVFVTLFTGNLESAQTVYKDLWIVLEGTHYVQVVSAGPGVRTWFSGAKLPQPPTAI